jgi:hypothetical protein
MPDAQMVAFENGVDKACTDWTLEVTKLIDKLKEDVRACHAKLGKRIEAVRAPQTLADKDFAKLPDAVNTILAQNSARLKGIVELELVFKIDARAKKLNYQGYGMKGKVRDL